jgi:transposase
MFGLPATVRVLVAVPPADLRKGYDGLARLARDAIGEDPLSGHLFVFANRRRDRIKVLYWDRDGYAIWMKRLEKGTYRWPAAGATRAEWTAAELAAVLGGIDLKATRRRPRFAPPEDSPRIARTSEHASSPIPV